VKDGALVEADDGAISTWADQEIVLEIPSQRIVATFRPSSASAPEPIDWNSLRAERLAPFVRRDSHDARLCAPRTR
jgi:hypothetical protein